MTIEQLQDDISKLIEIVRDQGEKIKYLEEQVYELSKTDLQLKINDRLMGADSE